MFEGGAAIGLEQAWLVALLAQLADRIVDHAHVVVLALCSRHVFAELDHARKLAGDVHNHEGGAECAAAQVNDGRHVTLMDALHSLLTKLVGDAVVDALCTKKGGKKTYTSITMRIEWLCWFDSCDDLAMKQMTRVKYLVNGEHGEAACAPGICRNTQHSATVVSSALHEPGTSGSQ